MICASENKSKGSAPKPETLISKFPWVFDSHFAANDNLLSWRTGLSTQNNQPMPLCEDDLVYFKRFEKLSGVQARLVLYAMDFWALSGDSAGVVANTPAVSLKSLEQPFHLRDLHFGSDRTSNTRQTFAPNSFVGSIVDQILRSRKEYLCCLSFEGWRMCYLLAEMASVTVRDLMIGSKAICVCDSLIVCEE